MTTTSTLRSAFSLLLTIAALSVFTVGCTEPDAESPEQDPAVHTAAGDHDHGHDHGDHDDHEHSEHEGHDEHEGHGEHKDHQHDEEGEHEHGDEHSSDSADGH